MGSIQKERDAGRPLAGEHDRLSVAKKTAIRGPTFKNLKK